MKDTTQPFFTSGMVFILGVLFIVSGIFAALVIKTPGDDKDNDEDNDEDNDNDTPEPNPHDPSIPPLFSGVIAEHFVEKQLDFGYRIPGTLEHRDCRDFIRDTMEEFGYSVEYQNFTHDTTNCTNIIARGTLREKYYPDIADSTNDTLILGAHYDTRPYSEMDPEVNAPIMGANDGASGVAVLLELARVLVVHPVNFNLVFVFFDLEDSGLHYWDFALGSKVYAESLTQEEKDRILGGIVVDMVGDKDLDIYYEKNSDKYMMEAIWGEAEKLGYREFYRSEKYNMMDDHRRLLDVGIPAVDIIDFDYPYWHTQEDTLDKISGDSLEKVGRVVEKYIYALSGYDGTRARIQDIEVPAGETLCFNSGVHHINGNLIINGSLKLQDTLLIINGEEENDHSIMIPDNGSLEMQNSILTSPNKSIIFEDNGRLTVKDSLIEQLWGDTRLPPYRGGVQIYSCDFLIQNSTIRYSASRGLFLDEVNGGDTSIIESCDISENGEVGLYLKDSSVTVRDSVFEKNGGGGIMVNGSGLVLEDSIIRDNYQEGSCTRGSCSVPDPSYGITISDTSLTTRIKGTTFSGIDMGVKASYIDSMGGTLTIENSSMIGLDYGLVLLNSSAYVSTSIFNATGIPIYYQLSSPRIMDNIIIQPFSGIYACESRGIIINNTISGAEKEGIALIRSLLIVKNNTISESCTGVYLYEDAGSRIAGNSIYNNTDGIYVHPYKGPGIIEITENRIFANQWAIHILGNSSVIDEHGNFYERDGVANSQGILREERNVELRFINNTEDINITITRGGEEIFSDKLPGLSPDIRVDLITFERYSDLTEKEYGNYTAEVSSGETFVTRDFNAREIKELTFDLGKSYRKYRK